MTLTAAYQLAEIGIFVATVVFVIVAWRQIVLVRKQATTTFEDNLTEQYRKIMESIPTDIWLGSELKTLGEEKLNRCRDAIYRYIDLSNEQGFLHNKKRICDETWKEWRDGIKSNMKLPAFQEVWAEVAAKRPESFAELRRLLA
jgi:hypothetical protein